MDAPTDPRAGDIWLIDLDPTVGREQRGFRPALVISNDEYNDLPNQLVFVVPITTVDRGLPLHMRLEPPTGGLTKPSIVMCDQIRAASIDRFKRKLGTVPSETLRLAQATVGLIIDR